MLYAKYWKIDRNCLYILSSWILLQYFIQNVFISVTLLIWSRRILAYLMSKCSVFMFAQDYSKINKTSQPFKCQALQRFISLFRYLSFFRHLCQINYWKYQQSNVFIWLLFSSCAFSSLENSPNLVSYLFTKCMNELQLRHF